LLRFEWRPGYEWDIHNALDQEFEKRFKDALRGSPAVVTCRSPWLARDLADQPGIFDEAPVIGVNFSILKYPCHYLASGGDPAFWPLVNPRDYPGVSFIMPGSQYVLGRQSQEGYANLWCFTGPAVLPPGRQKHQRELPRPWKYDLSGEIAVWLAWYMGASPVYVAGCDFRLKDGRIHGDRQDENDLDHKTEVHYRGSLPDGRINMQGLVDAMRASKIHVNWPGEHRHD
jgi:hypothetical protein